MQRKVIALVVSLTALAGLSSPRSAFAEAGDELIGVWTGTVTVQEGSQDHTPGASSKMTVSIQRRDSYLMADRGSPGECTPLEKSKERSKENAWISRCGRVEITYEIRKDKLYYDEADYSARHSYNIKGTLTRGR
jgi:hypothetical protein